MTACYCTSGAKMLKDASPWPPHCFLSKCNRAEGPDAARRNLLLPVQDTSILSESLLYKTSLMPKLTTR